MIKDLQTTTPMRKRGGIYRPARLITTHLISSSKYVKPAASRMNAPCECEQTQNRELT